MNSIVEATDLIIRGIEVAWREKDTTSRCKVCGSTTHPYSTGLSRYLHDSCATKLFNFFYIKGSMRTYRIPPHEKTACMDVLDGDVYQICVNNNNCRERGIAYLVERISVSPLFLTNGIFSQSKFKFYSHSSQNFPMYSFSWTFQPTCIFCGKVHKVSRGDPWRVSEVQLPKVESVVTVGEEGEYYGHPSCIHKFLSNPNYIALAITEAL